MSDKLLGSIDQDYPYPYLQSPIDDLWSFFYVTLWAALFNSPNAPDNHIRKGVSGNRNNREATVGRLLAPDSEREFQEETGKPLSPVMTQVVPVLRLWHRKLQALQGKSGDLQDWAHGFGDEAKAVEWGWHIIAVTGVCDFLEIFRDVRGDLQGQARFSPE